ncbi:MAG: hypothetical protein ACKN8Y_00855 [Polynucleobacter victoriensis]
MDNWQKYQLPLAAGIFLVVLCIVFLLDHFRTIAQQELSLTIQRQQLQIQALQAEMKQRAIKQFTQNDAINDVNNDDELAIPDVKYWGMMRVGSSTKALIEINHHQKLLKVGQEVDDGWLVKNFDQELIWFESKQVDCNLYNMLCHLHIPFRFPVALYSSKAGRALQQGQYLTDSHCLRVLLAELHQMRILFGDAID